MQPVDVFPPSGQRSTESTSRRQRQKPMFSGRDSSLTVAFPSQFDPIGHVMHSASPDDALAADWKKPDSHEHSVGEPEPGDRE